MKLRRILVNALLVVVILAIVAGSGGAFYLLRYLPNTVAPQSFPQVDGEIQADGLDAAVNIYRDAMGIPHIYASTPHDLFFAQGFVHAQDRFWQMDAWRHIGSGRLSEMFGSAQLETDAFLRTLGWRQTAEAEWDQLDPQARAILQSYTDGVNAYLKDHTGAAVSLEYAILKLLSPDYVIQPWAPVDSLTWGKAMAWDLRGNMGEEIERAVLLKTLSAAQIAELFPPYPEDHPVIVNQFDGGVTRAPEAGDVAQFDLPEQALLGVERNTALLDPVLGRKGDGIGSNSWAVSGKLTATGQPILANDPHLGIQMPSIWYQLSLHCQPKNADCPYDVAGFTFAGVPGVVIGHNDRISWGFTNVGPDVMDLYIERVNPENPNQYEVNGAWVDFETRTETIQVAGGDPVTLRVRSTRHGPVISETYGPLMDQGDDQDFQPFKERAGVDLPEAYVIALKWTALSPSTPFESIWGLNRAQNWEDFRSAARAFHVPAQNLIYADVEGNIGYQMPGDIPIRAKGDGRFPVPGWTDDYEWIGTIPFEQLPYLFNPAEGYIVTANNQVPPRNYPYLITTDWDYGFRANRITQMIQGAAGQVDVATIQRMQADALDANGPVYVPLLAQMNFKAASPNQAVAMDLLLKWDYQARADSPAAAVFASFWRHLLQNTFNDELPERYWPDGGSRWNEIMRRLTADSTWWDDQATPEMVESREDMLNKSFAEAVSELEKTLGRDPAQWRWGDLHAATFRNQTLGESGVAPIENLLNRGPFPTGGGEGIVNATGWSVVDGYETNWLPSMRMIVDWSNLNQSVTVHTTGQSGHAYHPHYADMAPLWAGNQYYPMLWDTQVILQDAAGHLVLTP
ncbi:MAG: penicillin acylase family protein [Anaerolineae bacterium]|nr:penicillin acylase family protein [Anaerolineae bacterium]